MPWKLLSSGVLLAVLAGCGTQSTTDSDAGSSTVAASSGCDSAAVSYVVGKTATQALLDEARKKAGAQLGRVITPNTAVTMDYNSQRLNLTTNDQLVITTVSCG